MANILSIEDDAVLQQTLSMALYNAGYEIHYAFNGKEGYDKILSRHPDLVLLDLMLPMMNGMEILKQMRLHAELRAIPVIVLTAMVDDENKIERALRQQSNIKYLRKPFQMSELIELIGRTLRSAPKNNPSSPPISKGVIRLDPKCRTLWIGFLPP
jgi:DNA-binding response OmpR family regulator